MMQHEQLLWDPVIKLLFFAEFDSREEVEVFKVDILRIKVATNALESIGTALDLI